MDFQTCRDDTISVLESLVSRVEYDEFIYLT